MIQEEKKQVGSSVNNDFEKSLIDNGYKFFQDNWKNSIRGFQKKITDEYGIKYFITGYHYNHRKQLSRPDLEDIDSYCFDVQFRLDKQGKDFCVDLRFSGDFLPNKWRPVATLQDVEIFYENAWSDMMADYYEFNFDITEQDKLKILAKRRMKKL